MPYVKPRVTQTGVGGTFSDSDYLASDLKNLDSDNAQVYASKGGFGYKNADGTFEVLDALPLGKLATDSDLRVTVRYDSDTDNMTKGFDSDLLDSAYVETAVGHTD
jgi:hypothetical protein